MPSSITLTVKHLPTSTSFFLSALQPLGYVFRGRQEHTIGFGPEYPANQPADFWITQEIPGVPAGAAHVAFPATSRAQVQEFFLAALKAGGKIHGEPCQRDATGYFSAAVIDFDGNSIEAVYRPGFGHDANRENVDARSMVSHRTASVKAPSTVAPARTVVSQARSKAPSAVVPAQSVVSQAKSKAPTNVSAASQAQPKPKASGDVLDTLINEARSAANVARELVSSFKGNSSAPPKPSAATNTGNGGGAGDAIVGTLLGVAAGAALTYAFANRSKDSNSNSDDDREDHKFQPRRPSIAGRTMTDPTAMMRPEYSSAPSDYHGGHIAGSGHHRAIEAAPSAYTYRSQSRDGQKLITMQDNDQKAIAYHSSPPKSDYASTIRPSSRTRRMSMDSGFGPGPRDIEAASHASSKASRHSKKSTAAAPPTSYRPPTALTEKMSRVSSSCKEDSGGREGSRSRANSHSRIGRSLSQSNHRTDQPRSRSHSRNTSHSRRSRRDEYETTIKGEVEEAKTVLHVTETLRRMPTYPAPNGTSHAGSRAGSAYQTPSRAGSKNSSRSRDPAAYPLPPSRAATWAGAGSDAGKSFVSARSNLPGGGGRVDVPRTIIGRLVGRDRGAAATKADSASVFSKKQDLRELDVPEREVGPEDSVSQVSVQSSRRSGRSRVSRG